MNDTNRTPYNVRGQLNGKILLNNVYKNILLESDIVVKKFSLLGSEFGDVSVSSDLDIASKIVKINASNNLAGVKMFDLKGTYDPSLKKMAMQFFWLILIPPKYIHEIIAGKSVNLQFLLIQIQ